MNITEVEQQIEVETPRGRGRIWLVTDYGSEIEKIFTILLHNGEIWEYRNNDIRLTSNITMGRTKCKKYWKNYRRPTNS
jgi:hypothetical protein